MKRLLQALLLFVLLFTGAEVQAYSGSGGIWAQGAGDFISRNFKGDSTGFGMARDFCLSKGGGVISVGPGLESTTLTYPAGANLLVIRSFKTGWSADPSNLIIGTSTGDSATATVWSDGTIYSFTANQARFQAALDRASATNPIVISVGPGIIWHSTTFWVRGNTAIYGAGKGISEFKRIAGTIGAGGAATTGNTFTSALFGASAWSTGLGNSNIRLEGFTLNGNCQAFPLVDAASENHMGVRFRYVDGVTIRNVEAKNYLQSGIQLTACKAVKVSDSDFRVVGQNTVASSRNGLDMIMNAADSTVFALGYGRGAEVTSCWADSVTDTAFHLGNNSDVTFSNLRITGATKYGFEFETYGFYPRAVRNITVNGVTATGIQHEFMRFGGGGGSPTPVGTLFENIKTSNVTCTFNHQSGSPRAIRLIRSDDEICRDIGFYNSVFDSINGSDTNNFSFFEMGSTHPVPSEGIEVIGCTFNGAVPTSTNTGVHGFRISGGVKGLKLIGNTIRDVPGVGIFVARDGNSEKKTDGLIQGNSIIRAGNDGIQVVLSGGTDNSTRNYRILDNIIEDACRVTGSNGIRVGSLASPDTVSNFILHGNTVREKLTTGTTTGIRITQTSSGVTDSINVGWNDVHSISATAPYTVEGSPTNVSWNDPEWNSTIARLGPFSTTTTGGAIRIIDGVTFPKTNAGIQAAANELVNGGTIILPGEQITGITNITLYGWTTIMGSNPEASQLVRSAGATGAAIREKTSGEGNSRGAVGIVLKDFSLFGNGSTGNGIDLGNQGGAIFTSNAYLSDILVRDFVGTGIKLLTNAIHIRDVWTLANSTGLHLVAGGGANHLSGIWSEANTVTQLNIECPYNIFDNVHIEETAGSAPSGPLIDLSSSSSDKNMFQSIYMLLTRNLTQLIIERTGAEKNVYFNVIVSGAFTWTNTIYDEVWTTGTGQADYIPFRFDGSNTKNSYFYDKSSNKSTIVGAPDWTFATKVVVPDSLRANKGIFIGGQFVNKVLRASATLDFDLSAATTHDLTVTVTGAAVGDEVSLGVPNASITANTVFYAWVSAANTVTVRAMQTVGNPNPASGTFKVTVIQ